MGWDIKRLSLPTVFAHWAPTAAETSVHSQMRGQGADPTDAHGKAWEPPRGVGGWMKGEKRDMGRKKRQGTARERKEERKKLSLSNSSQQPSKLSQRMLLCALCIWFSCGVVFPLLARSSAGAWLWPWWCFCHQCAQKTVCVCGDSGGG